MGSVTAVFTSENLIHPAAKEGFLAALERGWADPGKIHHPSRELAALLVEARETFARALDIRSDAIHFLGEPTLGFHLGINGLVGSEKALSPATSRQEIFAALTTHQNFEILPVDLEGQWQAPYASSHSLLACANVNGETGALAPDLSHFDGSLFIDSTADHLAPLPPSWSTALWDSKSWRGPSGIAILAIRDQSNWRNPLPHNDHRLVPGGANPALIIASALAIEAETVERRTSQNRIADLNLRIRQFLINEIGDVDIASPLISEPQFLSFSFLYVNAEELVEKLQHQGFAVDSGSACISANIEPSHVLAAMGRLTHGNIRLHLWPEITESIVDQFLFALKNSVLEIRTVK